ncbi:hypothetical protein EV182_006868 [Spiromyces aspiralis]|uniref:Uncharacterized protein n=1 Tax=Spiromyces aspiralis TaxID=68401 RepID=A0ACC1HLN6_9FUNG|nr:hypothetical protein EV182_006868 [Spiromyces aspiralis]
MLAELLSTSSTASAEPPKKTVQESPKTSDNSIDPNAIKRQKNTDAARRSRMRKILRIETLENRVTELETENISLNTKIGIIESEKLSLQQRESELTDHIRQLEKQLAAYQHGNMPLPSFFQ